MYATFCRAYNNIAFMKLRLLLDEQHTSMNVFSDCANLFFFLSHRTFFRIQTKNGGNPKGKVKGR